MSDPAVAKIVCRRCYAVLDAGDNYCRHCGTPTAPGIPAAPDAPARPPGWSESPWFVLPMLFLIFGPLAIPLLWRSRRFTLVWKSVLTVLVLAVTVYVCWGVWFVLQPVFRSLDQLKKELGRF
ncbi:MAG: hypothetical protein ABR915_20300 [Thermoguttaceae bacterium]|jgi:hypothetical protein